MKKQIKKYVVWLLLLPMLFSIYALPVQAASRTLINQNWTQSRSKAESKAKGVKLGTTTVRIPTKGRGYLKFKVPKTAEYSFTLSGLKSKKVKTKTDTSAAAATSATSGKSAASKKSAKNVRPFSNGYFYVMTVYPNNANKIGQDVLKTSGGNTNTLWLANQKVKTGNQVGWRLKKRTGKIQLEQGQTVYLYFHFTPGDRVKLEIAAK